MARTPDTTLAPRAREDVLAALRRTVRGEVTDETGRLAQYSADASNYRRPPLAVVFPRDREDIVAAVAACREHGVPITSRGAGTSTSGQAVGSGVVLDFSRHCDRILDLDPDARTARVEPGLVLDDLQAAAAPHGLLFGPDPSTHSRCTIGGMIGNNACGSHSLAWGRTSDNVVELEVLTYGGTVLTVGPTTRAELDAAVAEGGERGRLLGAARDLALDNLAPLRTELGRFPRQVSGYALEHLLPENGFNLARALVGSEGTCAVILSATVSLVRRPAHRALAVLGYPDACQAADAVPALLEHAPMTLEGLDRTLARMVRGADAKQAVRELPAGDAWLFAEVGADTPEEALARAEALAEAAARTTGFTDSRTTGDPARQRSLWRVREDGAGLATRLPDGSEAWPGWEDAAVPPGQLGSYLREFYALLDSHGLRGAVYGHFGEGCLHVRIDFDFATREGTGIFRAFLTDAARLVAAHGGSPSGEHGDGQARSEFLPLVHKPATMALFERFKDTWDPTGGLNPGIIVRALRADHDLRQDPDRPLIPLETVLSYPEDGGDFARAVGRCVGVGKCRTTAVGGSVMCPSYRVTRDERDSTRGRARLLYEMTQGEVITDGWRSTEVRDALDLCLSCKGCSTDCPVGVDMASYKAEFLHHHYRRRIRPLSHYSMGWLPLWSRAASVAPRVVNAVTRSRLAPLIRRAGGIAPERPVPAFAEGTFLNWFRGRRTALPGGERGPVMLWVDSFNNHFSPQVLRAGVAVLESAGFEVHVPPGTQCCGLTWMTTGQLGVARKVAGRAVEALSATPDMPVVGLEPSCTSALRSDVPRLLDTPEAHATAARVGTFAEFLLEQAPDYVPPQVGARSLSQTHCHQHADGGTGADEELLRRAGVDNTRVPSSCCGLAGNFGFEREHYDISVAAAEEALLPALRAAAPDTVVLADGFSCRTQIQQLGDRTPVHLAELLAGSGDQARPGGE
ncbi:MULTISPECIES: FAD-binding and (Fe-S)-binding domain-containing protein [Streptomyces]|uniref:FAD-binding and (Fe-S)-binding domain-containing protein n=1 Tax=Streptomyces TaxID=1883 RepID=UPI00081BAD2A|nr:MULTISPECIES: FAD-binding and (Fe-S)-binding domain-containing protein [unclassified Streptomyces]MYQ54762.1 FAD-binding protein [Streptomyces sp. SID4941]SCE28056.1 FAD/FMN-containing dehydrogenase [Streptomyces sp. PalvLS-984]SDB95292.1 FAD/FMN-containing dehydrogenase [Streptomyces sp. AmelKG-A3]